MSKIFKAIINKLNTTSVSITIDSIPITDEYFNECFKRNIAKVNHNWIDDDTKDISFNYEWTISVNMIKAILERAWREGRLGK